MPYKINIELTETHVAVISRLLNAACSLYLGKWPEAFRLFFPRGRNVEPLPQDIKALLTIIDWKKYQKGTPRISLHDEKLSDDVRVAFDILQVLRSIDRKLLPTSKNANIPRIPVQFSSHSLPRIVSSEKLDAVDDVNSEDES